MVFAISLLLLASTPAPASTPHPEPSTGEHVAVIWGGGRDAEAAKASLAKWEEERALLADALVLAAGFPKMVSSASIPGLNPGFEIVLLGFCRSDEARVPRRMLKAYHPFVYERPVKQSVSACPRWKDAGLESVLREPETLKAGTVSLTRIVSALPEPRRIGDGLTVQWLDVVARDATGNLVGKVRMDDYLGPSATGPVGCETTLEPSRKTGFVMKRHCTELAQAACNFSPRETLRTVVRWKDQKPARGPPQAVWCLGSRQPTGRRPLPRT
ncbi:hypothetical protein JKA73_02425 [Myxococcus xanthus]|uniref:hypothetical protein n=1 Tax=Myxococcus xanthus TaxID=34 RepID=UPI00191788D6|nr:hypothetical protein [Myxococcus xanthus]QQR45022.1 hypothetical protein JKA73_02425 [Myxococcus xanthus]